LGIINLLGFRALILIIVNSHILILLIASLFLLRIYYLKREKTCDDIKYANVIFVGVLFLHMQFASTGWFYRYEAYLVLLGIVVISIAINSLSPKQFVLEIKKEALPYYAVAMLLILVIAIPFGSRTLGSLIKTPQATKNIYEQQYQMGTFLKQFYQGKIIAANDIGAITYLADIQLVDLWGLGSIELARLKLQKQFTTRQIYDLTHQRDVKIAIVYDHWYEGVGGLPKQWVRVGQWSISNNVICGGDTVSLYAVDPSASHELMQNLRKFAIELPVDVKQYGKYTGK
jgi:hypothetical protein